MRLGLSDELKESKNSGAAKSASNMGKAAAKNVGKKVAKGAVKTASKAAGPFGWLVGIGLDLADSLGITKALKAFVIITLSLVILMPIVFMTNANGISWNPFTHIAEYILNGEESAGEDTTEIQAQDLKYAQIVSEYMQDEYNELEEYIKAECEKKGVDYEASKENIVDNTVIPLVSYKEEAAANKAIEEAESTQEAIAGAIAWARAIAADDTYTYGKGYGGHSQCCVCANSTSSSDKQFTCMPFLAAAFAHGSGHLDILSKGRSGWHFMHLNDKNFKGSLGKVWKKVGLCKDLTIKDLQPGDVVIKWSDADNSGHAWLYAGNDEIIHAVHSGIKVEKGAAKKLARYGTKEGITSKNYVMRYSYQAGTLDPENFVTDKVRMGQACIDEKGQTKGGKAGDQTGGECRACNYKYSSSGVYHWEYVFRAKLPKARLKIANTAAMICDNNHIGYDCSEPDRKSLYKEAEKVKFNITGIVADCETTCSELANVCIAAAGLNHLKENQNAYVDAVRDLCKNSSDFTVVDRSELQPGDILVSGTHVAVVVSSPNKVALSEGSSKESFQKGVVDWVNKTVASKKYTYKTFSDDENDQMCPICHPGSGDGWNCIGFAVASWRHGGGIKSTCNCGVIYNSLGDTMLGMTGEAAAKVATQRLGVPCKIIKNNGLPIPVSMLEAGDLLLFYTSQNEYYHMAVYVGDGEYAESSSPGAYVSTGSKYKESDCKLAIRYAGDGADVYNGKTSQSAEDVKNGACAWAEAIANDNEFHYGENSWAHHNGCYFCGTQPNSKKSGGGDWEKTYCCNPFVHAAFGTFRTH